MNKPRLSPEEVISSLYHTEKWKAEMAKNPVAGAFSPQFESYDAGTGHMICSYPTLEEFKNPISVVHGGIIAGMLDTAMGSLAGCAAGRFAPTISLETKYLRPVPTGGRLMVEARLTRCAKKIIFAACEAWMEGSRDDLMATAEGTYYVV